MKSLLIISLCIINLYTNAQIKEVRKSEDWKYTFESRYLDSIRIENDFNIINTHIRQTTFIFMSTKTIVFVFADKELKYNFYRRIKRKCKYCFTYEADDNKTEINFNYELMTFELIDTKGYFTVLFKDCQEVLINSSGKAFGIPQF